MAGARTLQLGLELIVHDAVERFKGDLQTKLVMEPLLDLDIAGKPTGGRQARLELREHRRRQTLLAGRSPRFFVG